MGSEASVSEGKECDTAGTLEDNSEEEQGSNGSADHAASEEHSCREQTLESQMSSDGNPDGREDEQYLYLSPSTQPAPYYGDDNPNISRYAPLCQFEYV